MCIKKTGIVSSVLFLCLVSALLCGMSGMGTAPTGTGPTSSFSVELVDTTGNSTTIKAATIDGKTIFSGYLGKGKVQIPFENIRSIELQKNNACVSLTDSSTICNLNTNKISRLSGNTSFGTYSIPLGDIKRIVLKKEK